MTESALTSVLRLCARLDGSAGHDAALAEVTSHLGSWQELPSAAEAHGLAPLVAFHLARVGIRVPPDVRQQLIGLAILHRDANRIRFRATASATARPCGAIAI